MKSSGALAMMDSRSSPMPFPAVATVSTAAAPPARSSSTTSCGGRPRSALLKTTIVGIDPLSQLGDYPSLELSPLAGRGDHNAKIGPVKYLTRPADAQLAKRADVVDPGGVDEQDRTDRQQLHRLLNGVSRRAGHVRGRSRPTGAS